MTDNNPKREGSSKPRRPASRADALDRHVRMTIAAMPLAERQRIAGELGYPDGRPLTEGEARQYIHGQRAAGTGRDEVRRSLVVDDPLERRMGALNPDEIGLVLAGEWPVTA